MNPSAVACLVVALLLVGCTSPGDETGATPARAEPAASGTASPTLDPGLTGRLQVDQRTYRPGDELPVRWPGEQLRGIAYSIDAWTGTSWKIAYYVSAVSHGYRPGSEPTWWSAGESGGGWVDIGVGGPGPDLAIVPPTTSPGVYRICTANSPKQSCAMFVVG